MFELETLLAKLSVGCALPDKPDNAASALSGTSESSPDDGVEGQPTDPTQAQAAGSVGSVSGGPPDTDNTVQQAEREGSAGFSGAVECSVRSNLTHRLLKAGRVLGWSRASLEGWSDWAKTAELKVLERRVLASEARAEQRLSRLHSGET